MKVRLRLGLRSWLLLTTLVTALPLLLFTVYTIHELRQAQYRAVITALTQRTQSAANAIDLRINLAIAVLTTLASSEAARAENLRLLHRHAVQMAEQTPGTLAFSLTRQTGEQIFSTQRRMGNPLPPTGSPDAVERVFATGQPAASGIYTGPLSKRQVVAIGVPVLRDGQVVYCLRMIIEAESFAAVLRGMHLPHDWMVGIVDSAGRMIAHNPLPDQTGDDPVPPPLRHIIQRGDRGLVSFETGGMAITAQVADIPGTDWVISMGVPTRTLIAPLNETLTPLFVGILLVLGMGTASALVLSGILSRQLSRLSRAPHSLANGGDLPLAGSAVREVAEIGQTLSRATKREQSIKSALADAITTQRHLTRQLNNARLDSLTGLPARALFLDLAEMRRIEADLADRPLSLAMVMVDLDGFKTVNDRFGHARGDQVLCETAEIIRSIVRESDITGRLGGDEFVLCISAPTPEIFLAAETVANRLVMLVRQIGNGIGCSVGVALCPPTQADITGALALADQAMYQAKRAGKNRFVILESAGADQDAPAA